MSQLKVVAALWMLIIGPFVFGVQAKPLKAFILSGQSNMDGHGPVSGLSEEMRAPYENVLFFLNGRWGPLQPNDLRIGPEVSFGRAMAEAWPEEKIALIKYAYGGTGIMAWDPYWIREDAALTGDAERGSLYQILMSEIARAYSQEEEDIEIMGMLWMQGESDSLVQGPAEDYYLNFREFIETIRRDLGKPNLPFIFGRISQANVWAYQEEVRAAQARVEPEVPLTKMVDTDQLGFIADGIHYDAQGQLELGEMFAQAFLEVYEAERNLSKATRIFPAVKPPVFYKYTLGEVFSDAKIVVLVPSVAKSDVEIRENIPSGWHAANLRSGVGIASLEDDAIVWRIPNFSGEAEIIYDLTAVSDSGDGTIFSGTIDAAGHSSPISGISKFHSLSGTEAMAPLLPNTVTLDGRVDPDEWDGAYQFQFDRANKVAPGVAVLGPLFPANESNATVFLFHNTDYLCIAADVVDPYLDFDSARYLRALYVDCVTFYLDGNFSRLARRERNAFGLDASIVGDGSYVRGVTPPTPEALPESGYHSTDGTLWNYGANVKPDGSGYVVEFQIDKSQILDNPERRTIGFDVMIHDGHGTDSLLGKWGWRFIDENTGVASESNYDETLWGTIQLLDRPLADVSNWSIH
ncbi:MAG: sialate O-acetylesterase [bacterium]